ARGADGQRRPESVPDPVGERRRQFAGRCVRVDRPRQEDSGEFITIHLYAPFVHRSSGPAAGSRGRRGVLPGAAAVLRRRRSTTKKAMLISGGRNTRGSIHVLRTSGP